MKTYIVETDAIRHNLDVLLNAIEGRLMQNIQCRITLPMHMGGLVNQAYGAGQVSHLEYTGDAICFVWSGHRENLPAALAPYIVPDEEVPEAERLF